MRKLNLGSSNPRGRYLNGEWVNVDLFKCDNLDVQANILSLPFRDNTFEVIHSVHVLEHLTREKHLPVLKECYRVLKPGGAIFVETPDFEHIVGLLAMAYKEKNLQVLHKFKTSTWGKNERSGMAHYWCYGEVDIRVLFNQVGFSSVDRLTDETKMISRHFLQEPVILIKAIK